MFWYSEGKEARVLERLGIQAISYNLKAKGLMAGMGRSSEEPDKLFWWEQWRKQKGDYEKLRLSYENILKQKSEDLVLLSAKRMTLRLSWQSNFMHLTTVMGKLGRRNEREVADYTIYQSSGKKQVKVKRNGQEGMKPIAKNTVKCKYKFCRKW